MRKAKLIIALAALLMLAVAGLYASTELVVQGINVSPNPMDKYTVITILNAQPATFGVIIESDTGVIVKNLFSGDASQQLVLNWDRIGDDGSYTPRGKYNIRIIYDGRYTSTKKTLILK